MINNLIIIPYRDRNSHLKYFLKHVFPSMKKNLVNIRLVVIEQSKGNLFNKVNNSVDKNIKIADKNIKITDKNIKIADNNTTK